MGLPLLHHSVIRTAPEKKHRNQAISKIATEKYYVHKGTLVLDLFNALINKEEINAICITDEKESVIGLIVKKDFFALLSKAYARDILKRNTVEQICTSCQIFNCDQNVFTIAELLRDKLKERILEYFALVDNGGKFQGIFSTQDLLVYLSEITQLDIALAQKIQRRLVKDTEIIAGQTFEMATLSEVAKGVGGDFYFIKRYDEDNWFMCMCDVSGKGIAASMVTAVIWGLINVIDLKMGIKNIIYTLNNILISSFESEKYVTGVFLEYNEKSKIIQIADMGHSHTGFIRNNRFLKIAKAAKNIPLGIFQNYEASIVSIKVEDNDLMFVITDGIIEQENLSGEKYSLTKIAKLLNNCANEPVDAIRDIFFEDFKSFQRTKHLADDATFMVIKFKNQEIRV